MSAAHSARVQVGSLLAAVAATNVAYTILIPLVPTLSAQFGMSAFAIGLAFSGFAATKAISQPVGGWAVDRLNARTIALTGMLLTAFATAALGFATSGSAIIGCRLLWGVGEGIAIPALYRLASGLGRQTGAGESRVFGWFGAAAVVGMAAGPGMVGLFAGALGFRGVFLIGGLLTLLSSVLLAIVLPERQPAGDQPVRRAAIAKRSTWRSRMRTSWREFAQVGLLFGLLDFSNNFVYAALEPVLPLHASVAFGAGLAVISAVFFIGLVIFAAVAAVAGSSVERFGAVPVAATGFAASTLGLAAMSTDLGFTVLVVGFLLVMICQPVIYVCARSDIANLSDHNQGKAFGLFGVISDLGWVLGPLAGTSLLRTLGGGSFGMLAAITGIAAIASAVAWLRSPGRLANRADSRRTSLT
jgi:MFS family permease